MTSNATPDGWRSVRFGDVVRQVKETTRDPESAGLTRIVGLEHLDSESLPLNRWNELSELPEGTSFTRVFRADQVLFGKRRAYQRKVAVADFDGVCSGDILVFESSSDDLMPQFLPYLVQSEGFFEHALGTSAGSLSPRTKWQELAKYEFKMPPLKAQARTIELLGAVEAESAALASLGQRAADLRSAIVEDAASQPTSPLVSVRDIVSTRSQGVQVGPFGGSLSSKYFSDEGVPVLKINNITEDGHLDLTEVVRTTETHAASLGRYVVQPGDVVTAAQATIGRTALVPENAAGALISQHLIRIRVDAERYRPAFLAELFSSPLVLRQMAAVKTKTTRDGLNTADVESFEVPALSLSNQDNALRTLAHVGKLTTAVAAHQRSVSVLRRMLVVDALLRDPHV